MRTLTREEAIKELVDGGQVFFRWDGSYPWRYKDGVFEQFNPARAGWVEKPTSTMASTGYYRMADRLKKYVDVSRWQFVMQNPDGEFWVTEGHYSEEEINSLCSTVIQRIDSTLKVTREVQG